MNLGSILGKIGSAALKSIPGVSAATEIIEFVNDCLPGDKKVDENSTGDEVLDNINQLPAQEKMAVLQKQFDVQIAEIKSFTEVQKALSEVDIQGASTRPHIARVFAWNTVIISDLIIIGVFWAMIDDKVTMVEQIKQLWPFILGILSPFVVLLRTYFGLRSKEKSQKYQAVSGAPSPVGAVSTLIGKLIK